LLEIVIKEEHPDKHMDKQSMINTKSFNFI